MTNVITEILNENTDEMLALIVTIGTFGSFYVGVEVPTEPMFMILGYFFHKVVKKA
jgi:hypothetical protein